MRTRTTIAAKVGKIRDAPQGTLAEGLAPKKVDGKIKDGFWCITLQGREWKVPINTRGKNWAMMTSEELLEFAKEYCKEMKITKPNQLHKGETSLGGLYHVINQKELAGQKLIDLVFPRKDFEEMKRDGRIFKIPLDNQERMNWSVMSPEELLEFAKAYCKEKEITKRSELQSGTKSLARLYVIISQKELDGVKLLDMVFPRKEFEEMVLDGRIFKIPLDNQERMNWSVMSPEDLLEFAKVYCKENKITKRSELRGPKAWGGLRNVLKQKKLKGIKLIDIVFPRKDFEEMKLGDRTFRIPLDKKGHRNWAAMSSEWLLGFANAYCKENKITKRSELTKGSEALHGLYILLNRRELNDIKLIDIVLPKKEFEEMLLDGRTFRITLNAQTHRNWAAMSLEELLEFVKAYCKENGITKISELQKGPKSLGGLYAVLKQNGLLDIVFSEIEKSKDAAVLSDLARSLETFEGGGS